MLQRSQRRTQNGSERIAKTVKGGLEKSPQLSKLYEGIAQLGGAAFFDAGMVITTDGADGLHLTAEAEKKLGTAVAAKVKLKR